MRPVSITCTHAAECTLVGSQPAEDSGSSPSPPWALSPARSPPAVRLGPFLLVSDTGLGWEKQHSWEVVKASNPPHSPIALHSVPIQRATTGKLMPTGLCRSQDPDGTVP